MAIHVVRRQWNAVPITINETDAVVHDQEIAVADVDEAVLVRRDHDEEDPGIVTVERTKIRTERGKWNVNMSDSVVEKDCTMLKRNI